MLILTWLTTLLLIIKERYETICLIKRSSSSPWLQSPSLRHVGLRYTCLYTFAVATILKAFLVHVVCTHQQVYVLTDIPWVSRLELWSAASSSALRRSLQRALYQAQNRCQTLLEAPASVADLLRNKALAETCWWFQRASSSSCCLKVPLKQRALEINDLLIPPGTYKCRPGQLWSVESQELNYLPMISLTIQSSWPVVKWSNASKTISAIAKKKL